VAEGKGTDWRHSFDGVAVAMSVNQANLPIYALNFLEPRPLLADVLNERLGQDLSLHHPGRRLGFGESVNLLFSLVCPAAGFLLVNPDCIPFPGCFDALYQTFREHQDAGIVEARQWPLEHPKEFDPVTLETPWSSCACCLLSSEAFSAVGGFDPMFFLYNEDVDLSWRLRLADYKALYCPDAFAAHYTGLYSYRPDRLYPEHYYSAKNFIALSYKFFGDNGERRAIALLQAAPFPQTFKDCVMEAYRELKPRLSRYPAEVDPRRFKITGFNLYHDLRFSY
jgi:GT2 family glycosyltransferase